MSWVVKGYLIIGCIVASLAFTHYTLKEAIESSTVCSAILGPVDKYYTSDNAYKALKTGLTWPLQYSGDYEVAFKAGFMKLMELIKF
jgi:hypothetical protein